MVALVFGACNSSGNSKEAETTAPAPATSVIPAPNPGANQLPATTNTPASNSTPTALLNPAHGAPGHRCDIPVGSPLNTPASKAPAVANPTPMMVQPPALSQPGQATGRINPPHGQPGHDCSIPVGKPLKG